MDEAIRFIDRQEQRALHSNKLHRSGHRALDQADHRGGVAHAGPHSRHHLDHRRHTPGGRRIGRCQPGKVTIGSEGRIADRRINPGMADHRAAQRFGLDRKVEYGEDRIEPVVAPRSQLAFGRGCRRCQIVVHAFACHLGSMGKNLGNHWGAVAGLAQDGPLQSFNGQHKHRPARRRRNGRRRKRSDRRNPPPRCRPCTA